MSYLEISNLFGKLAMPLTRLDQNTLRTAIRNYGYSLAYIDHRTGAITMAPNRSAHEQIIRHDLINSSAGRAKTGLASIQYWGNVSSGYAIYRKNRFLQSVTRRQVLDFQSLVCGGRHVPTLHEIRRLGMPLYSAMSFISKIIMFLDPGERSVLDLKLARLARPGAGYPIDGLRVYRTTIPITHNNSTIYLDWCRECTEISDKYYSGRYRAVDVERGFFHLLGTRPIALASNIYHNWR